jgi:hypothetical protein
MYKNRIRRTAANLDLQSLIRRSEIPFDERARYVEFVCNVWNEGRFGPGLADPVTLDWSDRPEPASFLDLDDRAQNGLKGSAPIRSLSILGRARFQALEAACRRAKQMGLSDTNAIVGNILGDSAANQGRGSPQTPKHQRCVVIQPAAPPQDGETNDPSRNAAA